MEALRTVRDFRAHFRRTIQQAGHSVPADWIWDKGFHNQKSWERLNFWDVICGLASEKCHRIPEGSEIGLAPLTEEEWEQLDTRLQALL